MRNQLLVTSDGGEWELRHRVGLALRTARLARGLTQGELAGPYTAAFVSRVEHGDAIPSLSSLEVLAQRMSLSLSQFFELVERTPATDQMRPAEKHPPRAPPAG